MELAVSPWAPAGMGKGAPHLPPPFSGNDVKCFGALQKAQ